MERGPDRDEVVDVVDEQDQVVGQAPRWRVHEEFLLHRAVHALLTDAQGRVLLQQRSSAKRTSPRCWTSSASGHVPAGQPPRVAAVRELEEEVGLLVEDLVHVGTTRHLDRSVGEREIVHVFVGTFDGGEPSPNPREVMAVRRSAPSQIDRWVQEEPSAFASSFFPAWERARPHL